MRTQPDAPTATLPVIPDTQRIDMAALIAAQNRHPSRSLSMTQLAEQVAAAAPTAAQLHDLAETVAALHDLINDSYTAQAEQAAITQQATRAMAAIVATLLAVSALGITTFLSFRYSGAVRAHDLGLKGDTELLEGVGGVDHRLPVGLRTHDDADLRSGRKRASHARSVSQPCPPVKPEA